MRRFWLKKDGVNGRMGDFCAGMMPRWLRSALTALTTLSLRISDRENRSTKNTSSNDIRSENVMSARSGMTMGSGFFCLLAMGARF